MTARSQAAVASFICGIAWLAWEVSRRVWDDGASSDCASSAGVFNDAVFAIANAAGAVALASLALTLRGAPRWVAFAAAAGAAAQGSGNAVEHCVAEPFFLLFVAGAMAYAFGSLALAGGLLISGQLGRWPGLLVAAAAIGLMAGTDRGGAGVTGVAWLAFAASLVFLRERTAAERA